MPKKPYPYTYRIIFYKYDISEAQDGSKAEYEMLHYDVINNGFFVGCLDFLEQDILNVNLDDYSDTSELPFNQVHEIVVDVEPWANQDYWGEWDGGVHWQDFAYRRLTGEELKEFLIYHPRCNRLQGLLDEYEFRSTIGPHVMQEFEWNDAVGVIPDELKDLTDEQMKSMMNYFKDTLYKYLDIGGDE